MVRSRCGVGLLAIFAGFSLFAGPALAKQATVTLHDGRTLTGELTSEEPQRVVLTIAGIRTPIERADIASVEVRQDIEEEYQQRRATVADDDVEGRLAIAQWLLSNRALELAQREAGELQRMAPDHERVRTLSAAVDAAIELDKQGSTPAGTRGGARPPRPSGQAGRSNAAASPDERPAMLDDKQVTLIKVWELPTDLSRTQVRVQVPRPVIEEIFDKFREDQAVPKGRNEQRSFFSRSAAEQLGWMFDMATRNVGVREYYDDVIVPGDPETLLEFRRAIYTPYVQRYFRRHFVGDGRVPGLVLFSNESNSVAEMYTNFYILSQTEVGGQAMINRSNPRQSLLLQWGLPRRAASFPAPDVPGWRPFFTGPQDPNYDRYAAWIDSLYATAGDYGINYTPPGGTYEISLEEGEESAAPPDASSNGQAGSPSSNRRP